MTNGGHPHTKSPAKKKAKARRAKPAGPPKKWTASTLSLKKK
jgi:hypothetical protein